MIRFCFICSMHDKGWQLAHRWRHDSMCGTHFHWANHWWYICNVLLISDGSIDKSRGCLLKCFWTKVYRMSTAIQTISVPSAWSTSIDFCFHWNEKIKELVKNQTLTLTASDLHCKLQYTSIYGIYWDFQLRSTQWPNLKITLNYQTVWFKRNQNKCWKSNVANARGLWFFLGKQILLPIQGRCNPLFIRCHNSFYRNTFVQVPPQRSHFALHSEHAIDWWPVCKTSSVLRQNAIVPPPDLVSVFIHPLVWWKSCFLPSGIIHQLPPSPSLAYLVFLIINNIISPPSEMMIWCRPVFKLARYHCPEVY